MWAVEGTSVKQTCLCLERVKTLTRKMDLSFGRQVRFLALSSVEMAVAAELLEGYWPHSQV